jgi:hypothetical protein
MLFPLLVRFLNLRPFAGTGRLVSGSIEHCGGQWQAAARSGRKDHAQVTEKARVRPAKTGYKRGAAADF